MPYVKPEQRLRLERDPSWLLNVGELNYVITKTVLDFLNVPGGAKYEDFNAAIGALESAKIELYRRLIAPYEDRKIIENGDVYEKKAIGPNSHTGFPVVPGTHSSPSGGYYCESCEVYGRGDECWCCETNDQFQAIPRAPYWKNPAGGITVSELLGSHEPETTI